MTSGDPPRADHAPLTFPCSYPVKVMGRRTPEFRARVSQVLARCAPAATPPQLSERLSRDGTYVSLTATVHIGSRAELDSLYRELHATGLVLYAL
jgi:putative lipoic acid-binding regulatory protein